MPKRIYQTLKSVITKNESGSKYFAITIFSVLHLTTFFVIPSIALTCADKLHFQKLFHYSYKEWQQNVLKSFIHVLAEISISRNNNFPYNTY